jgi:2-polyprenyl-3-methyl-5-hydroxy-6-metoxy-1,4-benzoquinol methylase
MIMKSAALLSKWRNRKVRPYVGSRVLDVGCGVGRIIEHLPPSAVYVGVDSCEPHIEMLRERYPEHDFYTWDLNQGLPALPQRFDTVLILAVLEHIKDAEGLLEECHRHMEPGGRCVITIPTPFGEKVHAFLERLSLVNPEVEEAHVKVYRLQDLERIAKEAGCEVIKHKRFQLGCNRLFVYSNR